MSSNRRTDRLDTVWSQDPHTRAKHDLLVRYLAAWFPIMGRTQRRAVVLDMFAGPGVYEDGQPGSPLLVLDRLLTHSDFLDGQWDRCEFVLLFNEMDPKRHAVLEQTISDYVEGHQPWPKNVLHHTVSAPFQELARELLDGLKGPGMAPAFVFLDPFGIKGVPLSLIGELVSSRSCDMLLYFGINTIKRFATAGNVDQHLEELFGTEDYRNAPSGGPDRLTFLHDLYEQQLRAVCRFSYVQSFAMVNKQGHIGNYMFFCTRDAQAFNKMKAEMWRLAPTGDYRFEDRFVGTDVLFGTEDATAPLEKALSSHFAGQEVPIEAVVDWVIKRTPFHSGQVKMKTLALMQKQGKISAKNQRTKNRFPDGTVVVFP